MHEIFFPVGCPVHFLTAGVPTLMMRLGSWAAWAAWLAFIPCHTHTLTHPASTIRLPLFGFWPS